MTTFTSENYWISAQPHSARDGRDMGFFLGKYNTLDRVNREELRVELMLRDVQCEAPWCFSLAVGINPDRIPAFLCAECMPTAPEENRTIYKILSTLYASWIYSIAVAAHKQPDKIIVVGQEDFDTLEADTRALVLEVATPDHVKVSRANVIPELDVELFI